MTNSILCQLVGFEEQVGPRTQGYLPLRAVSCTTSFRVHRTHPYTHGEVPVQLLFHKLEPTSLEHELERTQAMDLSAANATALSAAMKRGLSCRINSLVDFHRPVPTSHKNAKYVATQIQM